MQSAANFDAALATFEQALLQAEALPSAPMADVNAMHMAAAKCAKQLQSFKGVVDHCTGALVANPDDVAALTLRAQAYEGMENAEKAMQDYTAARGLAPWDKNSP